MIDMEYNIIRFLTNYDSAYNKNDVHLKKQFQL